MSELTEWIQIRGYKTFFVLNSAEHEIYYAYEYQITSNCTHFVTKHS